MPPSNTPTQPTDTPTSTPTDPIEPTDAPEQPAPPQTPSVPPASGKHKWPLIVTIVAVVLLVAGAAAYFFVLKPDTKSSNTENSSQSSADSLASDTDDHSASTKTTSLTTTDSPNDRNGTVSFTHPADWQVTKVTDEYGTEKTIIKSKLGNTVTMYTKDSVGGSCEPDTNTYTLVKRLTTRNPAYVFTEYQISGGTPVLQLEPYYDQKTAAHQALKEGQSNTNVCQNLFSYPIAKDINITLKDSSGKEASYTVFEDDTEFIAMLQSFNVTDD